MNQDSIYKGEMIKRAIKIPDLLWLVKQYKNVKNFRNFFTPKLEKNSFVSTALLSWGPPAKQKWFLIYYFLVLFFY